MIEYDKIYRSRAPLRIGLAGGGTDVSPFPDIYGGAILNATISAFANASIIPREDGKIILNAVDRDERLEFDPTDHIDTTDPTLILQKGVYNRIVKDYLEEGMGLELTTSIDVSAGSGLGTSSTLVVAILGAFVEMLNLPLGEYDIARLAYDIERVDLAMAGGKQDQYAATFGGVNFMEFLQDDNVIVNPLRIKDEILQELEYHLVLLYTQTTRESAKIIEQQKENIKNKDQTALDATLALKKQAFMMKEALLKGELAKIGQILDHGWQFKKKMAKGITNDLIDKIYSEAISAGASGGKISGAGGGGFMLFYCPGNTRYVLEKALKPLGAQVVRYNFLQKGLTTWTSAQ
ncbi:MAG: D-glycero-alpha-D-manno-heptose-7-phosphate kinase [Saprospiraceae bacterium]|jgi:D-glycero-alpha-D-manno-heptose-7-phosphate kinase